MRKLAVLLVLIVVATGCKFPQQYADTSNVKVDESKTSQMSDEEFIQKAKAEDPQFRKTVESLDQKAGEAVEFKKNRDIKDAELKQLVDQETQRRGSEARLKAEEDKKTEKTATESTPTPASEGTSEGVIGAK
jgi:hypothetical protein